MRGGQLEQRGGGWGKARDEQGRRGGEKHVFKPAAVQGSEGEQAGGRRARTCHSLSWPSRPSAREWPRSRPNVRRRCAGGMPFLLSTSAFTAAASSSGTTCAPAPGPLSPRWLPSDPPRRGGAGRACLGALAGGRGRELLATTAPTPAPLHAARRAGTGHKRPAAARRRPPPRRGGGRSGWGGRGGGGGGGGAAGADGRWGPGSWRGPGKKGKRAGGGEGLAWKAEEAAGGEDGDRTAGAGAPGAGAGEEGVVEKGGGEKGGRAAGHGGREEGEGQGAVAGYWGGSGGRDAAGREGAAGRQCMLAVKMGGSRRR